MILRIFYSGAASVFPMREITVGSSLLRTGHQLKQCNPRSIYSSLIAIIENFLVRYVLIDFLQRPALLFFL
jgi:hypothetical protein